MNEFDRFNQQFDRDWRKGKRVFGAGMVLIVLLNIAWMALLGWAVIELVQWLVTK